MTLILRSKLQKLITPNSALRSIQNLTSVDYSTKAPKDNIDNESSTVPRKNPFSVPFKGGPALSFSERSNSARNVSLRRINSSHKNTSPLKASSTLRANSLESRSAYNIFERQGAHIESYRDAGDVNSADSRNANNPQVGSSVKGPEASSNVSTTDQQHDIFIKTLCTGDVDTAIYCKNSLLTQNKITHSEISQLMKVLLSKYRLSDAKECYEQLQSQGQPPEPKVFTAFLFHLAGAGDFEYLNVIAKRFTGEDILTWDVNNYLCEAYITAGKAYLYFQNLIQNIEKAFTQEERDELQNIFPRRAIFDNMHRHPELHMKIINLAKAYATKGAHGPMNIVWQYFITRCDEKVSIEIWDKYFYKAKTVQIGEILKTVEVKEDPRMLKIAISQMRNNVCISAAELGEIYSLLMKLQIMKGYSDFALITLEQAIKDVPIDHIDIKVVEALNRELQDNGEMFPPAIQKEVMRVTCRTSI